MTDADATRERLAEYLRLHTDVSAIEALAATDADPQVWREVVADALNAEEPHVALAAADDDSNDGTQETPGESNPEEPQEADTNPGGSGDETTTRNADMPTETLAAETPVAPVDEIQYCDTLTAREWWVTWILDGVGRKRPVAPWQNGHAYPAEWHSDLAADDRPETTFEEAKRWADFDLSAAGLSLPDDARSETLDLGVILPDDRPPREERIALIDWDDVRDPETEEVHETAAEWIAAIGGYVEVSTSGKGLHQFVIGGLRERGKFIAPIDDEPFIGDDKPQVEIYDGGRHVAMTGRHVEGTGEDLVEGQSYIDDLVTEYADAEKDAGHRRYDPSGDDDAQPAADGDAFDSEVPTPEPGEYNGPDIDALRATQPANRSLDYHAVVETFYRGGGNADGFAHIQNWRLEGFAAALGHRDGLSVDDVLADLSGRYLDDSEVPKGCNHETPHRVEYGHERAKRDRFAAPSPTTLVDYGVLPPAYLDADDDSEPVAPIAIAKLDALDSNERRRAARKRGLNIPTTSEGRERLRNSVMREIRNGNTTVIDAPTAIGKSHGVSTEPWKRRDSVTGGEPVIHSHSTTEARDQAAAATNDSMATSAVLKGRKEKSPVARGDHDPAEEPEVVVTVDGEPASEWFDRMCDDKGLAFSTALAIARERNDQGRDELPPFGEEDPAVAQWNEVPRDDDGNPAADVIHCTDAFLHVPSLRTNTNIIIDEQPDFREELSQDRVRRMVNAYLKHIDAPVTNYERFVVLAQIDHNGSDAANERDALDSMLEPDSGNPPPEWFVENPDAHALAPDLTWAIWKALRWEESDRNGRRSRTVFHEPPRFDADQARFNAGTWLSVVIDDDHNIRSIRATPDFSEARSVVGLDAHPSMPLWQLNADPDMTRDAVLDATERRLWRRYERGLQVVQIGEATRPRSGGNALDWMNDDRVRAVLSRLREHYGDGFKTALSTVQTEHQLQELLREVGIDADDDSTMHYGEEKSRNDFADEKAGYVYGCMDPGDDMVLDALAELGVDAEPTTVETDDGETKREKGRTFDGPDADTAAEVLASVRENHVAQAAGRYARNADDDHSATVYLDTDAAPAGFVDAEVPGVEWLATDTQREILDELAARPAATTAEIADDLGCSKEHVRQTLTRFEQREEAIVERHERAGDFGADLFETSANGGDADDVSITNDALREQCRWSLAIVLRHTDHTGRTAASEPSPSTGEALAGGDGPPDPGD